MEYVQCFIKCINSFVELSLEICLLWKKLPLLIPSIGFDVAALRLPLLFINSMIRVGVNAWSVPSPFR